MNLAKSQFKCRCKGILKAGVKFAGVFFMFGLVAGVNARPLEIDLGVEPSRTEREEQSFMGRESGDFNPYDKGETHYQLYERLMGILQEDLEAPEGLIAELQRFESEDLLGTVYQEFIKEVELNRTRVKEGETLEFDLEARSSLLIEYGLKVIAQEYGLNLLDMCKNVKAQHKEFKRYYNQEFLDYKVLRNEPLFGFSQALELAAGQEFKTFKANVPAAKLKEACEAAQSEWQANLGKVYVDPALISKEDSIAAVWGLIELIAKHIDTDSVLEPESLLLKAKYARVAKQ